MKTAELFCGTKSFSKVMSQHGHGTLTLDFEPKFEADVTADVLSWQPTPDWYGRDLLWASPPCEGFSVMNIGKNWNYDHTPKTPSAALALDLVARTLWLIAETQPTWWFIENPVDKLRRINLMCENETICSNPSTNVARAGSLFPAATTIPTPAHTVMSVARGMKVYRNTITYCQYGDRRQKPTDIWTNAHWWKPKPTCARGAPCHDAAPRGSKTGTQGMGSYKEKARIPAALFEEILEQYAFYQLHPNHIGNSNGLQTLKIDL